MTNVFFTSDTHFGHRKIIEMANRPFHSVEEMDECMIDCWNSVVQPRDIVYHLGDFSFHRPKETQEILDKLNGNIFYLWGNHDGANRTVINLHKKVVWSGDVYGLKFQTERFSEELRESLKTYGDEGGWKTYFHLYHYPIMDWNMMNKGSIHLHGHCHGNLGYVPGRIKDVGVDTCNFYPISVQDIGLEMSEIEPIKSHHNPEARDA